MTALFGGSVEIRTPSLLRAKQLLIPDRAPDPLVLSAGEIACLVYFDFQSALDLRTKEKGPGARQALCVVALLSSED